MIHVYGVPSCDKIKKTKTFLEQNNIKYTFINVRSEPLSKETLSTVIEQLGLDVVLNRKGILYRKLGLKHKNLTNPQLFNALLKEQGMIKRPLVENDGRFHCGYDETAILDFVK